MNETKKEIEYAILAGVHTGGDPLCDTTEESIEELARLADTAGAVVVGTLIQNRESPESGTYLGEGKLEELKMAASELGATMVIFDDELSPIQIRNIERELEVRVIDRSMLILDIFASRALSAEGKIQVELAQLKYMLPRLAGIGSSMSRLGAGIGTRGPGETKLETDRRHIRRKIAHLSDELEKIEKHRELIRERRKKDGTPVIAVVGYTNAGKSTLLNKLTGADALAEDKLFATLDPLFRALTLPDGRSVLMADTVGFIRKLPHHLIKAFKSTLDEAALSDCLLIVADASSDEVNSHLDVVFNTLSDIGAVDKPTVCAFNKAELLSGGVANEIKRAEHTVYISAKTGEGLDKLLEILDNITPGKLKKVKMLIPYNKGTILSELHTEGNVESENYTAEGTEIEVKVSAENYRRLKDYIIE
ncbi:MAG: GTPase HflX [Clostridia bacterium]|nr:GTPase HflX [Clostridia bacterium]